ncbi:UNVERIFIED_CONTAM: hypothetical protein O8I53_06320 [Campylobacter lari]
MHDDEFLSYVEDQTVNYHLSYKESNDVIEKLRKQVSSQNGTYGAYLNYSTGLRLIDKNNKEVDNQSIVNNGDDKYLFATVAIDPNYQKEGIIDSTESGKYTYRSIFTSYKN